MRPKTGVDSQLGSRGSGHFNRTHIRIETGLEIYTLQQKNHYNIVIMTLMCICIICNIHQIFFFNLFIIIIGNQVENIIIYLIYPCGLNLLFNK